MMLDAITAGALLAVAGGLVGWALGFVAGVIWEERARDQGEG